MPVFRQPGDFPRASGAASSSNVTGVTVVAATCSRLESVRISLGHLVSKHIYAASLIVLVTAALLLRLVVGTPSLFWRPWADSQPRSSWWLKRGSILFTSDNDTHPKRSSIINKGEKGDRNKTGSENGTGNGTGKGNGHCQRNGNKIVNEKTDTSRYYNNNATGKETLGRNRGENFGLEISVTGGRRTDTSQDGSGESEKRPSRKDPGRNVLARPGGIASEGSSLFLAQSRLAQRAEQGHHLTVWAVAPGGPGGLARLEGDLGPAGAGAESSNTFLAEVVSVMEEQQPQQHQRQRQRQRQQEQQQKQHQQHPGSRVVSTSAAPDSSQHQSPAAEIGLGQPSLASSAHLPLPLLSSHRPQPPAPTRTGSISSTARTDGGPQDRPIMDGDSWPAASVSAHSGDADKGRSSGVKTRSTGKMAFAPSSIALAGPGPSAALAGPLAWPTAATIAMPSAQRIPMLPSSMPSPDSAPFSVAVPPRSVEAHTGTGSVGVDANAGACAGAAGAGADARPCGGAGAGPSSSGQVATAEFATPRQFQSMGRSSSIFPPTPLLPLSHSPSQSSLSSGAGPITGAFTFQHRRPSYAVSIPPELEVSVPMPASFVRVRQPNLDCLSVGASGASSSASARLIATGSSASSPSLPSISRRRSNPKMVPNSDLSATSPIAIPSSSIIHAIPSAQHQHHLAWPRSPQFTPAPSSFPPTSPILPPPPPGHGDYGHDATFFDGPVVHPWDDDDDDEGEGDEKAEHDDAASQYPHGRHGSQGQAIPAQEVSADSAATSAVSAAAAATGWKRHTRVHGGGVCLACLANGGGFYGENVPLEERIPR